MFCPQCGSEYRPGFAECPFCHVRLVEALAAEARPEEPEESPDLPFDSVGGGPLDDLPARPERASDRDRVPEDHLKLVTVFRGGNPAEVAIAKSVLQAAGIEFVTKNENVQDLFGWGRFPRGNNLLMGPIELQVRSCDAEDAIALFADATEPECDEPTD